MEERKAILAQVPLFASLPESELEVLADTLRTIDVEPGTILFSEGDRGDHFYVIYSGQIEVLKALGTPDERLVGVRGPGEFIGEMSLFNLDHLRTATIRAAGPSRVLEMTRQDFDALLDRQPRLAYEMVRVLSTRLTASNDQAIRDLQAKNVRLAQAYQDLQAAQAQIIEKEKLERELQVAHRIQMSLLPDKLPQMAGLEMGARIIPMSAVGGDFYDFIALDEDTVGIAIGDVSDHGVPAALFMALTMALLRAEACHGCSPRDVLQNVNRQLLGLNRESMFVTVLYGVLNRATLEFRFSRAGHEMPIVVTSDGQSVELGLEPGGLLGLFENPSPSEQTLTLQPGSTLVLYTDGVVEAMNEQRQMFGEERLLEAISAGRQASAQAICDELLQRVTEYCGEAPQHDDITLVCVHAA